MRVFISHNKADVEWARLLAVALVQQGFDVWFDQWEIRPGDSIVGGIERGVADSDIFVLVWSRAAQRSKWVGTELRAFLRRQVDEEKLRIVPVMTDDTPLPALVADFKGFLVTDDLTPEEIASQIAGRPVDHEIAQALQERLLELVPYSGPDPMPVFVCPKCGSTDLNRYTRPDPHREDEYYVVECKRCGWYDAAEL